MPWQACGVQDQRVDFIRDWRRFGDVSGLARSYGISRVTAYKWIARFSAGGYASLADRPPIAKRCPHAIPDGVREELIRLKRKHPSWGPKKLAPLLRKSLPDAAVPAASTAGDVLRRAGLIKPRRRRPAPPSPPPGGRGKAANDVWCVDYKGEFRTGDGRYCYPLTVTDEASRYILACRGFPEISAGDVREVFQKLFARHGLPRRIRSDNGAPFAGNGVARLSRLSVWWMRLGIELDRNVPGHPEHNGRHERMHRDLKAETTRPPAADLRRQQRQFDEFCSRYNQLRPHEALGQTPPAQHYVASPRSLPRSVPPVVYPGHFEQRYVSPNGKFRFRGTTVFISQALGGQRVGLHEVDDGVWAVRFANLRLGTLSEKTMTFSALGGKARQGRPSRSAAAPSASLLPASDTAPALEGRVGVETRRPAKAAR